MKKAAQKTKEISKNKLVKRWLMPALTALIVILLLGSALFFRPKTSAVPTEDLSGTSSAVIRPAENIALPQPDSRSSNSIESVLRTRRSRRNFLDKELSLKQISQILWAGQGVTVDWGGRTATSSKSTFPLTLFLIVNNVTGLEPGQYQYIPGDRTPIHELRPIKEVDLKEALYEAVNESTFRTASAVVLISGNMGKMSEAYGGIPHDREVYIEAGYVAQNLFLQAESLRLGMSISSTFDHSAIRDLISLPPSDVPILLIPIGVPAP